MDLTRKDDVLQLLTQRPMTSRQWNDNVDKITEANGGKFPDFWRSEVIEAGLYRDADRTPGFCFDSRDAQFKSEWHRDFQ